jgi:hypothetical protein
VRYVNESNIERISKVLLEDLEQSLKLWRGEILEKSYINSLKIGKFGWTLPFSFTNEDLFYCRNILTKEDMDTFFLNYYSENLAFDRMIKDILNVDEIKNWHSAIKQCTFAHKNGLYILSVSTLLPILEGILSTFHDNRENTKMKKICREMLKESKNKSMLDIMIWTSCSEFINNLYENAPFSEAEPVLINRHWILHGRTTFHNSEIDSIRLFNAIGTLSNIFNHLNKKQVK